MRAQVKLRCYNCRAIFIVRLANTEADAPEVICPSCHSNTTPYVVVEYMEIGAQT